MSAIHLRRKRIIWTLPSTETATFLTLSSTIIRHLAVSRETPLMSTNLKSQKR